MLPGPSSLRLLGRGGALPLILDVAALSADGRSRWPRLQRPSATAAGNLKTVTSAALNTATFRIEGIRIMPPGDYLLAHYAIDFGNLATGKHHAPPAPEMLLADPARPLPRLLLWH